MGPLEKDAPWSTEGIPGVRRFLERVWRRCVDEDAAGEPLRALAPGDGTPEQARLTARAIARRDRGPRGDALQHRDLEADGLRARRRARRAAPAARRGGAGAAALAVGAAPRRGALAAARPREEPRLRALARGGPRAARRTRRRDAGGPGERQEARRDRGAGRRRTRPGARGGARARERAPPPRGPRAAEGDRRARAPREHRREASEARPDGRLSRPRHGSVDTPRVDPCARSRAGHFGGPRWRSPSTAESSARAAEAPRERSSRSRACGAELVRPVRHEGDGRRPGLPAVPAAERRRARSPGGHASADGGSPPAADPDEDRAGDSDADQDSRARRRRRRSAPARAGRSSVCPMRFIA